MEEWLELKHELRKTERHWHHKIKGEFNTIYANRKSNDSLVFPRGVNDNSDTNTDADTDADTGTATTYTHAHDKRLRKERVAKYLKQLRKKKQYQQFCRQHKHRHFIASNSCNRNRSLNGSNPNPSQSLDLDLRHQTKNKWKSQQIRKQFQYAQNSGKRGLFHTKYKRSKNKQTTWSTKYKPYYRQRQKRVLRLNANEDANEYLHYQTTRLRDIFQYFWQFHIYSKLFGTKLDRDINAEYHMYDDKHKHNTRDTHCNWRQRRKQQWQEQQRQLRLQLLRKLHAQEIANGRDHEDHNGEGEGGEGGEGGGEGVHGDGDADDDSGVAVPHSFVVSEEHVHEHRTRAYQYQPHSSGGVYEDDSSVWLCDWILLAEEDRQRRPRRRRQRRNRRKSKSKSKSKRKRTQTQTYTGTYKYKSKDAIDFETYWREMNVNRRQHQRMVSVFESSQATVAANHLKRQLKYERKLKDMRMNYMRMGVIARTDDSNNNYRLYDYMREIEPKKQNTDWKNYYYNGYRKQLTFFGDGAQNKYKHSYAMHVSFSLCKIQNTNKMKKNTITNASTSQRHRSKVTIVHKKQFNRKQGTYFYDTPITAETYQLLSINVSLREQNIWRRHKRMQEYEAQQSMSARDGDRDAYDNNVTIGPISSSCLWSHTGGENENCLYIPVFSTPFMSVRRSGTFDVLRNHRVFRVLQPFLSSVLAPTLFSRTTAVLNPQCMQFTVYHNVVAVDDQDNHQSHRDHSDHSITSNVISNEMDLNRLLFEFIPNYDIIHDLILKQYLGYEKVCGMELFATVEWKDHYPHYRWQKLFKQFANESARNAEVISCLKSSRRSVLETAPDLRHLLSGKLAAEKKEEEEEAVDDQSDSDDSSSFVPGLFGGRDSSDSSFSSSSDVYAHAYAMWSLRGKRRHARQYRYGGYGRTYTNTNTNARSRKSRLPALRGYLGI